MASAEVVGTFCIDAFNSFTVVPRNTLTWKIAILICLISVSNVKRFSDPSCDFEEDFCGWEQSKSDSFLDFDWTRQSGSTPSIRTGPSSGHGGTGYYIYIETSGGVGGDKAILTFKGENSQPVCLSFYYHMYGDYMGTLNIYNQGYQLWTKSDNQGNEWKKAEVLLVTGNFDIMIQAVRTWSFRGDIAIDDISVADGYCATECGISPETRIIGGVDAVPGKWPWQVALLERSSSSFICGGSLIAPDWIVTAAHCISTLWASYYTIRLGEHNLEVTEGTEQDIQGKRVIKHPSYDGLHNNDIALIQLERPATLNTRVGTVCLPAQEEEVPTSARCFITGWGSTETLGSLSSILQQAELPPVTNDACAEKLAESPSGSSFSINDQMICAGVEGSDLSGCHGDSGGPYVCQASGGNWVLQGSVSWGSPSCTAAYQYTVFARVAQFRDWINENTHF